MAATEHYDMTPLDVAHRIDVFIVVDELDPVSIKVHDDANIGEIRLEISKFLKIPIEEQDTITCTNNDGNICDIELTKEDEENAKKLTDYDPQIINKAVFNLDVKDSFDISLIPSNKSKRKPPKQAAPISPESNQKPKRSKSKQTQKQQKPTSHGQKYGEQQKVRKQQQSSQQQQQQQQQQSLSSSSGDFIYQPTEQGRSQVKLISKYSKTHCRILFLFMEIQLILLIVNWGDIDMIMYLIAILFALSGWRGCRTLHPIWILAFLLYLILEMLLLSLFIIVGIAEGHESIYGSTAAYIALLLFELTLDVTWAYFYFKFFRMVMALDFPLRAWASKENKKTVIFC